MSGPWPTCPVCQRAGWSARKPAQAIVTNGRVPKVRTRLGQLVDSGDGQLRVYRCGPVLGLWHVTNLTDERFQLLIAPTSVELPDAPTPIPSHTLEGPWRDYLYWVAGEVVLAILVQHPGRALPSAGMLVAHYGVDQAWAQTLVEDFAEKGLLRKIGGLYVTGTPRTDGAPGP